MSIAEQAQLFANATLIVGEYGSALMNAVFCNPGAIIGAIGVRSRTLGVISALRELRLSYFDPTGDAESPDGYDLDAAAFQRWISLLQEADQAAPSS
jgi:capsular polysaccharide biosynthesis protein